MPNTKNTIVIKEAGSNIREEYIANAAITPGMLVEIMSTGKVCAHASKKALAERMFAVEDSLQGKGIDDVYAATDQVPCAILRAGDWVNAFIRDGENLSIGDKVCSNGDGTLIKWEIGSGNSSDWNEDNPEVLTSFAAAPVGVMMEAINLSGSSGTESSTLVGDRRALVRVM